MLRTLAASLSALALVASTGCRSRPAPGPAGAPSGGGAAAASKAAPDPRPGEPLAPDAARLAVRRGQEVREGTLLAALDDGAAAAARRQAEAAVAAARAQLALADDALARATKLRQEEGVSEAQLFQARSQRDLAAAQLAAAEAQVDQAQVNLAHHTLRAPFAGVVTHVPDGLGVTVAPGVPVVTLVSTRALVLETSVTQDEAAELRPGARASVTVASTGVRADDAVVSVVVPAVDAATNRVPVEVTVPNADGRLLPNAFARAELPRGAERTAFR